MNEKVFEDLDGIELPDGMLKGIAGGVLDEEMQDWLLSLIKAAKRCNMSLDNLLDRVRLGYTGETDPAEIQLMNESIEFISNHW